MLMSSLGEIKREKASRIRKFLAPARESQLARWEAGSATMPCS
ncbi:hypothetical protein A2U01_0048526 [Trifolium medium]|uniref:Uncharacterized protein n=1 Tax=Trifolium medium TaxID=97028 RepID=A0A392QSR5_9FABA|nr:hypothetical protein [Trifolium medium]